MSDQPITPELRRWILEQTAAGQPADAVLQAMRASGWHAHNALAALEDVVHAERVGARRPDRPAPAVDVPEPLADDSASTLWAGDRSVQVLVSLSTPRVVVFGDLLAADECAAMIALARERLVRSETVQTSTGSSEINDARTSDGMFFERGENELCRRFEARIAALLHWPVEHGEGLQVLRYRPGAEYKPHYDYFDPAQPGTGAILRRGGQRVASLVCYLNTPEQGGATTFPDAQLRVTPIQGNAVFFSYARPHPSSRTLHGGAPVQRGEKWVATKWLRQGRFD